MNNIGVEYHYIIIPKSLAAQKYLIQFIVINFLKTIINKRVFLIFRMYRNSRVFP